VRWSTSVAKLPGKPDLVFARARVVVFCDGDFWHGKGLYARLKRLADGHNGAYWVAKIHGNVRRDRRQTRALREAGWHVLRYWESDIKKDAAAIAAKIAAAVYERTDLATVRPRQ
jgi:DNA mismatch endonuclease, patch repair protein